jgi:hypothetical protein
MGDPEPGKRIVAIAALALLTLIAAGSAPAKEATRARFTDGQRTIFIDSGVVRIVIDKVWGGAIREIWFAGQNLINNYDGGRLAGVAFYDSYRLPVRTNPDDSGWNPSPSDKHNDVNPPLDYSFVDNVLYIKAGTFQWYPDNKGGGPGRPVATDVIVETWIEFVDDQTIHLRYKASNTGHDRHGAASQEFPFAYVRTPFNRFVSYTGDEPWQMQPPTIRTVPVDRTGSLTTVAREYWGGYVNADDVGLVMFAPQNYPEFSYSWLFNAGPRENTTLYLLPRGFFGIDAGQSREINVYLFAGKWQDARRRIYGLHDSLVLPDVMPGFGTVDARPKNQRVSGTIPVDGWALDDRRLMRVEVKVDDRLVGTATYGIARPDVVRDYPGLPGAPDFGFTYQLDTTAFANGVHRLQVLGVDAAGNRDWLINGDVTIDIRN